MPLLRQLGLNSGRARGVALPRFAAVLVRGGRCVAAVVASLLLIAETGSPADTRARLPVDVVFLKDGDRLSGRIRGSTEKNVRLETPYGRPLLIPRAKIEKIRYADGREEVMAPGAAVPPSPVRVQLTIVGDSFWQAWDADEVPEDPALRLLIAVDGLPVAAYVDRRLDPDIPGAVVNTFAFEPAHTGRTLWNETRAQPPEIAPGRVALNLELLPAVYGTRRLILKYQINLGPADEPVWRDLAEATGEFQAFELAPTALQIRQARGEMSFGGVLRKKRMRAVETFSVVLEPVSSR